MNIMRVCIIILIPLCGVSGQSVRTGQGTLLGREHFVSGRTVYSYRGIQYAEHPTGARRFRHSRPYSDTWSGTKPAREDGPPCPQPYQTVQASEECLHLSLWTPSIPSSDRARLRPVLVYLTGTLFTTDIADKVSPEDLVVARDVVVVTVSSRLNVFGFLSLGNVVLPGNSGLLDQYYALYWVVNNIQYFGGDPTKVTLAGSGSGGASALYHALSPRSSNLIQRVMAVSGTPLASWGLARNPVENAKKFIDKVNCYGANSQTVLRCLQSKSIRELISAMELHISDGNISSIFGPVDDSFLDKRGQFIGNPIVNLRQGRFNTRMSFMIGQNEDDGSQIMFHLRRNIDRLNARDLKYFVENTIIPTSLLPYGDLARSQIVQQLVQYQYFPTTVNDEGTRGDRETLLDSLSSFLTASYYLAPIKDTMDVLSLAGATVYSFVNRQVVAGYYNRSRTSAGAGTDMLYLFGPTQFARLTGNPMTLQDREVSLRVQDLIVPFIEQGSPPASFRWPRYSMQGEEYMEINTITLGRRYKEKQTQFWLKLIPSLGLLATTTVSSPTESIPLSDSVDVYSTLTWLLLAVVLLLLILLAALWVAGRKRMRTSSNFTLGSGLGGSSCIETRGPRPGSGPRSRWRESVTNINM